ncbi:MAG: hypothetical protein ACK4K9_10965 [Bacteroidia bacterium]
MNLRLQLKFIKVVYVIAGISIVFFLIFKRSNYIIENSWSLNSLLFGIVLINIYKKWLECEIYKNDDFGKWLKSLTIISIIWLILAFIFIGFIL